MLNLKYIQKINQDIKQFKEVFPVTEEMHIEFEGISRLVMLDRYSFKDIYNETLSKNDLVVLTVKEDPNYPVRGLGIVQSMTDNEVLIKVEDQYKEQLPGEQAKETGLISKRKEEIEKPLELFYEQIAKRVAKGMADQEKEEKRVIYFERFYHQLLSQQLIPAGRVLYGAGTNSNVTYFNCFVMPFIHDSRDGLAKHRQEVMEIMSRGGGVGTNGSTLRPRSAIVHGVNGKSSGAVSWLNDLANLTHLVEQGGSRRGAQMIMLADWHPDVFEFVISKIQNQNVLRHLIATSSSQYIKSLAEEKLDFKPLVEDERLALEKLVESEELLKLSQNNFMTEAKQKLKDNGTYDIKEKEFLTGANISICLTREFMSAVERDALYDLKFPDVENYNAEEMADYDENWSTIGDVRKWEESGRKVKVYRTIKARELWELITFCATYSAEPGIFFIDNANEMTNATAYNQTVVATNPCGEQPLTPYAVCNLAAINLAKMVDKETKTIKKDRLIEAVKTSVRFQDNVIDATPYFLESNKKQAKGERRIGLGVMGLADMLIYCDKSYGSKAGNQLVEEVFETMAVAAYETSIELAKEKGSFPFLIGKTEEETRELRERFITTGYMKKMPEHIKQGILSYGIRNSHLLTVAPTGSTGTMVGVSTGLEPYFSFSYFRSGRLGKFIEVKADIVKEYQKYHGSMNEETLPDHFVSAMDLSPQEHVDVQCTIQKWVDSSISKTVNAPSGYSVRQVADIYESLYKGGAKGGTVYVDGSRDSQVLTLTAEENDSNKLVNNDAEIATVNEKKQTIIDIKSSDVESNICPFCHEGTIEEIGGCSTCTHCKIQLKCGL